MLNGIDVFPGHVSGNIVGLIYAAAEKRVSLIQKEVGRFVALV